MAANARHSCAAPHQSAALMAEPCKGRHQMECGEQRDGVGRDKRTIGLLFLEWLAANLNHIPVRACASPKSHAHQPLFRHSAASPTATMTMTTSQQREPCLSYLGAFRYPREATMQWHELSPALHALSLAHASRLPLFADGLFVCNSHIGMAMEEAMTHTGRCDVR